MNDKRILFIIYGQFQTAKNTVVQRLIKLKYIDKGSVYSDINHPSAIPKNAVIDVSNLLDTRQKAEQLRLKFVKSFNAVLIAEVTPGSRLLKMDDESFIKEIDIGVQISDTTLSIDDRIKVLISIKKNK